MTGLLGNLARAFPFLTFLVILAVLIVLFRSWSRVSSGSVGAGPLRTVTPRVPGLQGVPWQALTVDQSLSDNPADVVAMLLQRAEDFAIAVSVPPGLPPAVQAEVILQQLEEHLELPPLQTAGGSPASAIAAPPPTAAPPSTRLPS